MTLGGVAADGRQPLLPVQADVAEEVVACDCDFRGESSHRLHALSLPEPFFHGTKGCQVLRDDFDNVGGKSKDAQPHDETAAVLLLPDPVDRIARRLAGLDEPTEIVGGLEDRGCRTECSEFIDGSIAKGGDQRSIGVPELAGFIATQNANRASVKLPPPFRAARFDLIRQLRHAVGLDLQCIAMASRLLEILRDGLQTALQLLDLLTMSCYGRTKLVLELSERLPVRLLRGVVQRRLVLHLPVTFSHQCVDPDELRGMLALDVL